MKAISQIYAALFIALMLISYAPLSAQEQEQNPMYYVVSTYHWNKDKQDGSGSEWMEMEKEYLEKVTMKNEYIFGSSFYTHMLTPDDSELLHVQIYDSWEAIDKAAMRNNELAQAAWPEQESRQKFFQERNSYLAMEHSDEIYAFGNKVKPLETDGAENFILYMRKNKLQFPEDGSGSEYEELSQENFDMLISKNEHIRGYYPSYHYYGTDRRDFIEAFFVGSLTELDQMFIRNGELAREAWPDDDARAERNKKFQKYIHSHSDSVYGYIKELTKSLY